MKKSIQIVLYLAVLLMVSDLHAQEFHRGQHMLIPTVQVLPGQYVAIQLPESDTNLPFLNVFDPSNPYTYLQIIYDSRQTPYHIVYQTSFLGKMLFLAYSNNLSPVFNKREKPMYFFQKCIRAMQQYMSPFQVTDAAIKCIIDRLNYCSEE